MRAPRLSRASFGLSVALLGAAACSIEREIEREGGVHPPGFADHLSPAFHGVELESTLYEMASCRECHGDDYSGGPVGVSCNESGCHEKGVEHCGTCHDGKAPPAPETGSHLAHLMGCASCHLVPKSPREYAHPNGEVAVTLTGLAEAGDADPTWVPEKDTCQNTYCHGAVSPKWESPVEPLPCDACHGSPPQDHERFALAVAAPPEGCSPCHPGGAAHLDGDIDFLEPSCDRCHGEAPDGMPPPALDGSTSPASRGVGAHVRHTDGALPDRIGRPVACEGCHDIPASMRAEGHLDEAAPADVALATGSYDAASATCVVGCHWNRDPGPEWTDTSGAPRACDGCHDFPPLVTREGTPHPAVTAEAEKCLLCHQLDPSTHVDGHVDLLE